MLNYEAVRAKTLTVNELAAPLTPHDLRNLTNDMVDRMLVLISSGAESDAAFQPVDPVAHDRHAATSEEVALAWTLGHVVAHATASSDEAGALAAEMARGVPCHGRSRFEVPWGELTTLAACRHRLEESRRIRLASLDMWPDAPHLDLVCEVIPKWPPVNAIGRFVLGLMHDDSHLGQMAEIMRQAKAARTPALP
jgi:hypothetical protein